MAFPEGTRSADGRLKDFKKGVFFMALESGVPIVPIAINDTRLVMPKLGALVIPGRISIDVLPPISTAGYDDDNIQELIARVKGEIEKKVQV